VNVSLKLENIELVNNYYEKYVLPFFFVLEKDVKNNIFYSIPTCLSMLPLVFLFGHDSLIHAPIHAIYPAIAKRKILFILFLKCMRQGQHYILSVINA